MIKRFYIHTIIVCTIIMGIDTTLSSQTFYTTELVGIIKSTHAETISRAHVINLSSKTGTITNEEGIFRILANKSDIIQISSIGYKSIVYVIPNTDQVELLKYFTLETDTIKLAETTIYPFPETLEELKQEFLELQIEETVPTVRLFPDKTVIMPYPQTGAIIQGPFTAIYEKFSRSAKLQRKYEALVAYDLKKQQATKIYNSELVKKITGLENEADIQSFMDFCELEPGFVLHARTYDLYLAIKNCYHEYAHINR